MKYKTYFSTLIFLSFSFLKKLYCSISFSLSCRSFCWIIVAEMRWPKRKEEEMKTHLRRKTLLPSTPLQTIEQIIWNISHRGWNVFFADVVSSLFLFSLFIWSLPQLFHKNSCNSIINLLNKLSFWKKKEEKKISADPKARVTELLKKVFEK